VFVYSLFSLFLHFNFSLHTLYLMANEGLKILPFYSLSDSELHNFLRLDHHDILFQNNILSDYLRNIDCVSLLDELNFGYVTDREFNNKVQSLVSHNELSFIHLNICSLNCNHLAPCQFLELLVFSASLDTAKRSWYGTFVMPLPSVCPQV